MPYRSLALIAVLALAGCSGNLPFSSGALTGTTTPVPQDWSEVASADIVQLETNAEDPYSVNLWVIGFGSKLYVHAGANRATWVEHIEDNHNVRLQVQDAVFELRAIRVVDVEEFQLFSDIYETKYGNRPRNEDVAEAYLFRLEARS